MNYRACEALNHVIADTDHMNLYEGTDRTSIAAVWRFFNSIFR